MSGHRIPSGTGALVGADAEMARLRCGRALRSATILHPTVGDDEVLTMKSFRRWILIVLCAVLTGLVVRLRSKGESPPTTGGWRELEGPDFR